MVDEIFAVGDLPFKLNCYDHIARATREGRTVLFLSHANEVVRDLCDTAIVLDKGRPVFQGKSADAVSNYVEDTLNGLRDKATESAKPNQDGVTAPVTSTPPQEATGR